jgi:hypothetical protein
MLMCVCFFMYLACALSYGLCKECSLISMILIMRETRVHLLGCMNIWIKNHSPTDLAKMFSYIRIQSDELNILNKFLGVCVLATELPAQVSSSHKHN